MRWFSLNLPTFREKSIWGWITWFWTDLFSSELQLFQIIILIGNIYLMVEHAIKCERDKQLHVNGNRMFLVSISCFEFWVLSSKFDCEKSQNSSLSSISFLEKNKPLRRIAEHDGSSFRHVFISCPNWSFLWWHFRVFESLDRWKKS